MSATRRLIGVLVVLLAVGSLIADTAAAAAPACKTAGLVVWLDTQGSGAAGSVYYDLQFTNQSGATCSLFGYPSVAAVSLADRQLGSAAARNAQHPPITIALGDGATVKVVLQIGQVGNYPPSVCGPTMAAGLRVYPPGQGVAKTVPFPFGACTKLGPRWLHVEAVQK